MTKKANSTEKCNKSQNNLNRIKIKINSIINKKSISKIKKKNYIMTENKYIKEKNKSNLTNYIFKNFIEQINNKNEKENYCESCDEKDYIEGDNVYTSDIQIVWSIKGYIYSGEKLIFNYLSSIDFELNQGFIIGSYSYKKELLNNFFTEKIEKEECFTQEIYQQKRAFDGYYCKKNVDTSKIENLKMN